MDKTTRIFDLDKDSPSEILDTLVYASYKYNRQVSPGLTPAQ